ncbi:MAG: coenzyme F420-0:L-glutamate ligase [Eubacteriales bacterium]|nr:coenzyme F420-0:L-glutamate ligase [Eubacteriales bacterium]
MERITGTVSRGLRAPIIKQGDDLKQIVVDTVLKAQEQQELTVRDRDILALTESILARAQGNYCSVDDIAADVAEKFGDATVGVIFPILSRNRFSIALKGFARGAKKMVIQLSYPSDEVGNHLVDMDALDDAGIDPYTDVLTEEAFVEKFGRPLHTFTGVDYVSYYKELVEAENCEVQIIFANKPTAVLEYTDCVLNCDIHTRVRTKRLLLKNGAKKVFGMDEIMRASVNGSGFNDQYGLLGSNKATEETLKLFPVNCREFVESVQQMILEKTGKHIEVMVYGDGAFKDPVGKIWELADPVVSPGYTDGLEGTPNELKLKYLADNQYAELTGEELKQAIKKSITEKDAQLKGKMASEGTTPRRLTDLIGSLADLTSGSGDKGTPFVYVQGYFDNYTD